MLKARTSALVLLLAIPTLADAQVVASQTAQKMEGMCAGRCHGLSLIAQQRLDRSAWTREVDKMILWGANVAAGDKAPLIDYLVGTFDSNRPRPHTSKIVPEGPGSDIFQISCMSCHDDKLIAGVKFDQTGWTREVDRMINWGAYVPPTRKEELIQYLLKTFPK
jgi:hypothetical protein